MMSTIDVARPSRRPATGRPEAGNTRRYAAILTAIIVISVVRIALTYGVFSETLDEPAHIGAGMEWLDGGTYVGDVEHPPLARVLEALGPHLVGIHYHRFSDIVASGNDVLYARGKYVRNLSLARIGVLPFFIAAILIVAAWSRRLWGDATALVAAALFANEPSVLAHAGLATTDMAAVAATIAIAYAFWLWLHHPDSRHAILLGLAGGLALVSKFSVLLFVPAACIGILIAERRRVAVRDTLRSAAIAFPIAAAIVTLTYRFALHSFFRGIDFLTHHAEAGHESYFFGKFSMHGWWAYYPVAIGLKTTIGFLVLLAIGIVVARRSSPVVAGVLVLLSALPSTINIGVRHVLPAYPFFAMAAAAGLLWLWNTGVHRWVAIALALASAVASIGAHPDYLPYFNAFTGPRPDRIFVDSNLDWGQDLFRLRHELRARRAPSVALAYAGNAWLSHHGLPPITKAEPFRYTSGWVAVSEVVMHQRGAEFRWLDLFNPVAHAGKSIRLYYIPRPDVLTGRRFAFETASRDRHLAGILVPIWFGGTSGVGGWRCDLTIANDSAHAVAIRTAPRQDAAAIATIPPNGRMTNALPLDAPEGVMLYVAENDEPSVHVSLRLMSQRGDVVVLPAIRERDAASSRLEFADVPLGPDANVNLRIYDVAGAVDSATVQLIGGARTTDSHVPLARGAACPECLASNTVALKNAFPAARGRGRIIVTADTGSLAAFITVTDTKRPSTYLLLPN
ncbi:MAG TPA: glycosyltransferase family 39 protein [Thermoanaerobaculia bacterium]|nr:glycosyltransferase family 39 protein [Thermoanaerobaculia bacterium]